MTFSQIDRVPAFKEDIESQASLVFKSAFGGEDKFNMFCVADTGEVRRNGNIGIVTSYDHSTSDSIPRHVQQTSGIAMKQFSHHTPLNIWSLYIDVNPLVSPMIIWVLLYLT